eukprot:symbB.v1.2.008020.t1/scaffold498.1/size458234/12
MIKVYIIESSNAAAIAAAGDGSQSRLQVDFQQRSFTLTVRPQDGASFQLRLLGLLHQVVPEKCKVRLSPGKRITLSLAKKDHGLGLVCLQDGPKEPPLFNLRIVIHSAQSKPQDQCQAMTRVMALLIRFDVLKVLWSNFYTQAEIYEPLLQQRPLLMDPVIPCANHADPKVFDASELMRYARSFNFFP